MSRSLARMPTRFELTVALKVAGLVGADGVDHARLITSFEQIGSGGLIRVDHLTDAAKLLATGGLLSPTEDGWRPAAALATVNVLPTEEGVIALATLILAGAPPLWLASATGGSSLNQDLIPDEDWKACCDTVVDPDRREALLLSVGRQFEEQATEGLADRGIQGVVEACRTRLAELGRDDLVAGVMEVHGGERLGYDLVCPCANGTIWRLKVKTARRALPQLMLTVARHEMLMSVATTGWALVACVANPDDTVRISGWCNGDIIHGHLPDDLPGRGEWATARLFLDEQDLSPGLPDLEHGPA